MAKRSREGHLAYWSIRLLRALNLLVIVGSMAFLTFEIQFEPHPAEFGWSLIMIAIFTFLSGLIGGVSSGQAGCFFPHMFFVFVSLMGLFSLSVLLFVRPDEVARKLLAFHITLSAALHHLLIDAYFFSLLGFLQLLIFPLAYFIRKRAYVNYYEEFDIPFHQPHLTTPSLDSACVRTSTAIILNKDGKQESSSHWKSDEDSQFDHPMSKLSAGGCPQLAAESLSLKLELKTLRAPSQAAAAAAEVLGGEDMGATQQVQKERFELLQKPFSSRSMPGAHAEVVDIELGRSVPDDHASSLSNSNNPRMTSDFSSSAKLENHAYLHDDDHSSSSICSSSASPNAWTDSDSTGSPCRWQYSISKENSAVLTSYNQQVSSSVACDIKLRSPPTAKEAVDGELCLDSGNDQKTAAAALCLVAPTS
ncbi:hypothetical protein Mapa_004375 [Marchantia paleacea]|nr:hypothetical protein Mapa_004375 [Marchantia paleacea]